MKTLAISAFLAGLTVSGAEVDLTLSNLSSLRRAVITGAMARLSDILHAAGFQLRWTETQVVSEIFLEFVPRRDGVARTREECCASRMINARIVSTGPTGLPKLALGFSLPLSTRGCNVTIFQAAIETTAEQHAIDPEIVLAHALAHEIGHVLLRSSEHSRHGLMSPAWQAREFDQMRRVPLQFSSNEIHAMNRTLAGEGCAEAPFLFGRNASSKRHKGDRYE